MRLRYFLAVILLLFFLVGCSSSNQGQDTYTTSYDQNIDLGTADRLDVTTLNGQIDVVGSDTATQVVMTVTIEAQGDGQDALKAFADPIRLQVTPGSEVLTLAENTPSLPSYVTHVSTHIHLVVPKALIHQVQATATNGIITLDNLEAVVEGANINGNITLTRIELTGTSTVSSTNGIIAADVAIPSTGTYSFSTINGLLSIQVPSTAQAAVDLQCANGTITNTASMTISSSTAQRIQGTMNGGGAQLNVSTTNGGITFSPSSGS